MTLSDVVDRFEEDPLHLKVFDLGKVSPLIYIWEWTARCTSVSVPLGLLFKETWGVRRGD